MTVCFKISATALYLELPFTVMFDTKIHLEPVTRGVLHKKLFLKISLYSQENTCVGVSF